MDTAGITCNKNAVPYYQKPPLVTSGIRLGNPAMTTRGLLEDDMRQIADMLDKVVMNFDKEDKIKQVNNEVKELTFRFPLYKEFDSKYCS